jgi:hypothetical protein
MDGARQTEGAVRSFRPLAPVVLRGLAVSIGSTVASVAVAASIIGLASTGASCDTGDLACVRDMGPGILAMAFIPMVIAVSGPLMASLLQLRYPALFVLPALWAVVVVSIRFGAPDWSDRWPFNGFVSSALILSVPYVLLALLVSWPVTDGPISRPGGETAVHG